MAYHNYQSVSQESCPQYVNIHTHMHEMLSVCSHTAAMHQYATNSATATVNRHRPCNVINTLPGISSLQNTVTQ
jgi:hypothetical protein